MRKDSLDEHRTVVEEAPLLEGSGDNDSLADERRPAPSATPLPIGQLLVLFLLRFCESASTYCIFPFIEKLLKSVISGGEEQVGYYAGIMDLIRHLISLVTVLYWSRMSDRIGRKPILLLGAASLSVSMFFFGLSKSFWALVISRCIYSGLNSNPGTVKSVIGEITDSTNSANAFALLHVPWAAGTSFGAFIGGWLAGPTPRFEISNEYPYLLPCATMAFFSLLTFAIVASKLQESLHKPVSLDLDQQPNPQTQPVPLKELLANRTVLIPVLNYSALSFLHTSTNTVLHLYLALPIKMGGLGLPPSSIGTILSAYGATNAVFQALALGRLIGRFGPRRVFLCAMFATVPLNAMFIVNNLIAKALDAGGDEDEAGFPAAGVVGSLFGGGALAFGMIAVQMSFALIMECGYGCIYMFITAASPNRQSLGSTNGLAQMMIQVVRVFAPLFGGSLLSYSIQSNLLWGYAIYVASCCLGLGFMMLARKLPTQLVDMRDETR